MRDHGTRACYVFGPEPGSDRARGCRCEPCKEANRAYARQRDRATRRPDEDAGPAYVDATEATDHLRWLATVGVGLRAVAARTGIGRSALVELRAGRRRRARPATIDRILAVGRSAAAPGALIDARPTWRLIDDMIRHGYTRTAIARALGSTAAVPALQIGRDQVTAATAARVADLHAEWMRPVIIDREQANARRAAYRGRKAS